MKLILLEGVDKCGKTTIANRLIKDYGFNYIKCSQPKGDAFLEYFTILDSIDKNKNYVIDRFHWGESVYGPIYRGVSTMDQDKQWQIEFKVKNLGGILIYASNTKEFIAEKFKEDKEEFTKEEHIDKLLKNYEDCSRRSILKIFPHIIGKEEIFDNEEFTNYLKS